MDSRIWLRNCHDHSKESTENRKYGKRTHAGKKGEVSNVGREVDECWVPFRT